MVEITSQQHPVLFGELILGKEFGDEFGLYHIIELEEEEVEIGAVTGVEDGRSEFFVFLHGLQT